MAEQDAIWVLSNRVDDRVVLWEVDPAHPGGEAFVGGSGPDKVARTPRVNALLRSGELVEIPEPPDGPKKPVQDYGPTPESARPDQPGEPTRLGRVPDPAIVPPDAAEQVQAQQERAGDQVPVPGGVEVPPPPAPER